MNSQGKDIEYSNLKKYFDGKYTKEEAAEINKWLTNPEYEYRHEKYLHLLWNEFDTSEVKEISDLDSLLDKIHHSIHLRAGKITKTKELITSKKQMNSFTKFLFNIGRIAAIFLLPFLIYVSWGICSQKLWVRNQADIVYYEIKSLRGAQIQFELPDGTKGNLNNDSRLRYPVKFTGKTREIELYGEAYLDVKHDIGHPFIIHTSGLDVKVLGTSLNVYSYPDEKYQEVTLESGSIELIKKEEKKEVTIAKLKPGQHAIYNFGDGSLSSKQRKDKVLFVLDDKKQLEKIAPKLKPGQQAMLSTKEGDLYIEFTDVDRYIGWTDGKLILRNDPMNIMLKRIGRWYGVKFNIKDEQINKYTYWATFEEENLEQLLRLLSLTGPLEFKMLPRAKMEDGTYKIQEIDVSIK